MSINATSLPSVNVIDPNSALFYSMDIHSATSEIYITDAIDYVQPGLVYRYDSVFNPLDTFQVVGYSHFSLYKQY